MAMYESMFILESELDEEKKESLLERIKGVVDKKGGELIKLESWGKRKLAYVIKKIHKDGEYFLMHFQGNDEVLNELEHVYKITDEIIRSLIIRLDK